MAIREGHRGRIVVIGMCHINTRSNAIRCSVPARLSACRTPPSSGHDRSRQSHSSECGHRSCANAALAFRDALASTGEPFASMEQHRENGWKALWSGGFADRGTVAVRRIPIPCILESAPLLDSLSGPRYSTGYDFFRNIRPAFGMSNSNVLRDRPLVSIDYRYLFAPSFPRPDQARHRLVHRILISTRQDRSVSRREYSEIFPNATIGRHRLHRARRTTTAGQRFSAGTVGRRPPLVRTTPHTAVARRVRSVAAARIR